MIDHGGRGTTASDPGVKLHGDPHARTRMCSSGEVRITSADLPMSVSWSGWCLQLHKGLWLEEAGDGGSWDLPGCCILQLWFFQRKELEQSKGAETHPQRLYDLIGPS